MSNLKDVGLGWCIIPHTDEMPGTQMLHGSRIVLIEPPKDIYCTVLLILYSMESIHETKYFKK
jgi:hypothetical protein